MTIRWAAVLLVGLTVEAHAQSPAKVLDRYVEAIGGKKAVQKIDGTTISGRVRAPDGRTGTFTQHSRRDGRLRVDVSLGDSQWRWGFNGRAAWQSDARDGLRTVYGAAAVRLRAESWCEPGCARPADDRREIFVGLDRARERPVLVVDTIMPDGFARTFSFDPETHLLLKQEEHSSAGTDVRWYGDYRRVGGVLEPHEIEWQRDGQTFLMSVDRVSHNAPVDEALFAFSPGAGGEPLPKVTDLLLEVQRNQDALETVLQSYAYTETHTRREIDSKGRVSKEEVQVFEVFHLAGQPVRRLVQRNGQSISAKEARDERERVDDLVRDYERQKRKAQASGERTRFVVPLGRGVPRQDRWISGLLRMCEFTSLRRERFGERLMIVAEFEPRRGAAVTDRLDEMMTKRAGVMWIDERARQVVRTDTFYRENGSITRKGSATMSEQVRLNDEVWLPSYTEGALSGRLFFGKQVHLVATFRQSDYKKFNVDSDYKIDTPEVQQP